MKIMQSCRTHHDLDRLEQAAIRRDQLRWVFACHESGHALKGIATGTKIEEVYLTYKAGRCVGGFVAFDTAINRLPLHDGISINVAGYAFERELCPKLVTEPQSWECSEGDFEKVRESLRIRDDDNPMEFPLVRELIADAKDMARCFRDSAIALALEVFHRADYNVTRVTGREAVSIFLWGIDLP